MMSQQRKTRGRITKGTVALALRHSPRSAWSSSRTRIRARGIRPRQLEARGMSWSAAPIVKQERCYPVLPYLRCSHSPRGGTMTDSSGSPPPGFAPSQRSIGLGNWRHDRARTFTARARSC